MDVPDKSHSCSVSITLTVLFLQHSSMFLYTGKALTSYAVWTTRWANMPAQTDINADKPWKLWLFPPFAAFMEFLRNGMPQSPAVSMCLHLQPVFWFLWQLKSGTVL